MYSPCSPSAPENMKCFYLFVPTKGPVSWNIDRDPIALSKTHHQGVMTCNPEVHCGTNVWESQSHPHNKEM